MSRLMVCGVPRYYLSRERDCLQFPWGGCGGNTNNFPTRHLCLSTCQPAPAQPHPGCGQLPDAGPCRDRLTRYYYDGAHCRLSVSPKDYIGRTCRGIKQRYSFVVTCCVYFVSICLGSPEVLIKFSPGQSRQNSGPEVFTYSSFI